MSGGKERSMVQEVASVVTIFEDEGYDPVIAKYAPVLAGAMGERV